MSGCLVAMISCAEDTFMASFVGSGAEMRRPAQQWFGTFEEAREWIIAEARAVRAPVSWVALQRGMAGFASQEVMPEDAA